MKKLFGMSMALIASLMLTACGGGSEKSDAKKTSSDENTVTVWAWDESFNIKALEEAKAFYDNKDVKLDIVNMSQEDIVQKLNTSLASGNTDGLPNIVLIDDYQIQGYLTSYPDSFAPLDDVVNGDDFFPFKMSVNQMEGKTYGVPFDNAVTGFYFRRDYLEEAGYKPEDLQSLNWEEFIEIARVVKEKTGHPMVSMNPNDLGLSATIMQSAGQWYMDEDAKKVNIKGNKALAYSLKIRAQMLKEGLAEPVADWDGGVNAVQSGNVASAITGCWYSSTIQGSKDQSGKWGIAPIPVIKDDPNSRPASTIGGSGWYVIKGLPGEKNAKDFLKQTFASNLELMDVLAKEIGLVSTLKEASKSPVYQEGVDFYGGQKVFEDFSKWSEDVITVNYGKDTYAIESVLTESLQQVVDGKDVEDVLASAQKQAEEVITQ